MTLKDSPENAPQHPIDHITNRLSRSEAGLIFDKCPTTWRTLLDVLRGIDRLGHPADTYKYVEKLAPEKALKKQIINMYY
ncbi:hypothetical protein BDC45DRAFT_564500 [Circinella umbellata]|nr:hypothetical protein BDC45DRAFT_564500 [Circinella umbellata]